MAFDFSYYSPTKVCFGKKTEERVGKLIKEFGGTRVLVHYGSKSAVSSGLLDKVLGILDSEGIFHVELGGAVPNPRLSKVYEGIALGKNEKIDFILAIGGGSAIDSAKAMAYALAEPEKDVWELYLRKRRPEACLPIGAILTIPAAGSETSASSVITNQETWEKRSCNSDLSRPKFAIMNPELTMSLPDYQTQSGCADIMMHTMERYFTNGGNMEITDEIAEGLLRTVLRNAVILKDDPENYEARAEVVWAGSLSHNNLTGCGNNGGDFMSHKLEHEMGGMFDVTHGAGLAAIWPSWARYVYKNCLPRFVKFAVKVMCVEPGETDEETAIRGIEAMEDFYRRIGMPTNMRELGIEPSDEEIEKMAESCFCACGKPSGSAMVLDKNDMIKIYKMAK
ncbi:MAG: iron-containing alcohol dehydrogenase [Oscillospiraceae bacterium]|nr:iron-containing alcohol dehydrogenase [Oscillospiraceae bacterium]